MVRKTKIGGFDVLIEESKAFERQKAKEKRDKAAKKSFERATFKGGKEPKERRVTPKFTLEQFAEAAQKGKKRRKTELLRERFPLVSQQQKRLKSGIKKEISQKSNIKLSGLGFSKSSIVGRKRRGGLF